MNAEEMDTLLGDPRDIGNPIGYTAVLEADERREMLAEGEKLLDTCGMNAEFVPAALGGRLTRTDRLAEVQRALWRRDPSLAVGYGFSSLVSSINVWTCGTLPQQQRVANLLLNNGRVAAAFHELEHGNDFAHADCTARPRTGGWSVSGRKEIVANLRRGDAMVLFARTDPAPGSRSHSQFLAFRDEMPTDRFQDLPRYPSSGLWGVQLGGMTFDDCPIPADAMIGQTGQGIEIALRSYQVTRTVIPAALVGTLDTGLRLALECALGRRLYGGAVADLPHVRAVIARAYADLLAIDAFTGVALRALHLAPATMGVYASATKSLTCRILLEAFADLRSVLGAQSYLRQGPFALFQKLMRDVAPATFTHVSRTACLVTILPQLPRLARRSWLSDAPAPPDLFDLGADLPVLDLSRLIAGLPTTDGVLAVIPAVAEEGWGEPPVARLVAQLLDELRRLQPECRAIAPTDLTIDASPRAFAMADRYTVLLAAASALAIWRYGTPHRSQTALLGILDRLCSRLMVASIVTDTERADAEQALFDTAVQRYQDRALFDLTARRIPG